jgi:2-phospho-L-lactate guanylyltransferase (CobY/MobA/RfbA family)
MPGPEFGQVLSLEERLEMAEQMLRRIDDSLYRLEAEIDLLVNYARASAQAQELAKKSERTYADLEAAWQAILHERKIQP